MESVASSFYQSAKKQAGMYVYLEKQNYEKFSKEYTTSTLNAAYKTAVDNLEKKALKQQSDYLTELNKYGEASVDVPEIIKKLGESGTLQEILNQAGEMISSMIRTYGGDQAFNTYAKNKTKAYNIASNVKSNGVTSSTITQLFNTIQQAQELVDNSSSDVISLIKDMADNPQKTYDISDETLEKAGKVATYLYNMVKNNGFIKGSATANVDSIIGTLNNIYGSVLGEQIVTHFFENLPNNQEFLTKIDQGVEQGFLIGGRNSNTQISWSGTKRDSSGTTFKTDTGLTGLIEYYGQQVDGSNYNLVLGSNISIKWASQSIKKGKSLIHIISGTPLGKWLSQINVNDAYSIIGNVFTHEGSNARNTKNVRNTLAANFFNQWLMGSDTGEGLAQYLFVNGKVCSMLDVVKNAAFNFDNAVTVSFEGYKAVKESNKQIGEEKFLNVAQAVERNGNVRKAINSIVLSASLNSNYLTL